MDRFDIPFDRFLAPPIKTWEKDWLLLAAGDFAANDWNCMTVAWGAFGVMWSKPLAMIVVRPTRHTYRFLERHDSFTLSGFHEQHRQALSYCGSRSGRDGDKAKACGITPIGARTVKAPGFAEAELVVECRKMYFDDLDPRHFLEGWIESGYTNRDYHRMYFGEIVVISGVAKYLAEE